MIAALLTLAVVAGAGFGIGVAAWFFGRLVIWLMKAAERHL